MELWSEIRRKVLVEGVSKRQICREYRVGWRTLEKMLEHAEPPGYRRRGAAGEAEARRVRRGDRRDPGGGRGSVDAAQAAPHGQADLRAAARRARLRGQRGHGSPVRGGAVAGERRGVRAAQPAAGRGPVRLRRGDRRDRRGAGEGGARGDDAALLGRVLRLGVSARVHRDVPGRATSQRSRSSAASPRRRRTTTRGSRSAGSSGHNERDAHARVPAAGEPLPVHAPVLPGRAGATRRAIVENLVGYGRRNFLVPVPSFASFTELNAHLARAVPGSTCTVALRGKRQTKAELLDDRPRGDARAAGRTTFEPRRVEQRQGELAVAGALRPQRLLGPHAFAHHELTVIGGIEQVEISSGTELVATHPRDWGSEHTSLRPASLPGVAGAQAGRVRLRPAPGAVGPAGVLPAAAATARGRSRLARAPASSSRCCA